MTAGIVMMPLKDITPYEKNPRRNDDSVDAVANSIRDFGFRAPILVDKDHVIIAGHTRYKAAKKLKLKTAPVVVCDDMTPEQVEAYRIADNSAGSASEWDYDLLGDILPTLDFDMADYGLDVVMEQMAEAEDVGEVIEDEPPEPDLDHEATVKRGEVYKLGNHRLMCGDSTSMADVEILMDGNLAEMVFTDPPWNVNYGSEENANPKYKNGRTILNDSMTTEDFKEFMGAAFEAMKSAMVGGGSRTLLCRLKSGGI